MDVPQRIGDVKPNGHASIKQALATDGALDAPLFTDWNVLHRNPDGVSDFCWQGQEPHRSALTVASRGARTAWGFAKARQTSAQLLAAFARHAAQNM